MNHFLVTKFFHLATKKNFSVATWHLHKKVNFGPCNIIINQFLFGAFQGQWK